jgi:acyl carrier protein phosphodiesterase
MRLFPVDDLKEVREATVVLADGRTARVTMHLLEGSLDDIRRQFDQSVGAFFDLYPEI